ncbi:MAG: hypothetical protein ACAH80_01515 [Alphaproteobacteria bacterium]
MLRILFVFLALLITLPAMAEEESIAAFDDPQDIPDVLKEKLRYGNNFEEQFVSSLLQPIRSIGRDHKSIDREDIERVRKRDLAQRRSQQYVQLLRFDLDYDGKITGTELRKVFMDEQGENANPESCNDLADRQMKQHDVDGDGEISLQEMAALPADGRGNDGNGSRENERLLALDTNGDGKLTVEEMETLARKAFATVDGDGDGSISPEESSAFNELRRATRFESAGGSFRDRLEKLKQICGAPPAKEGDKVVFLNVYAGAALSTHSVAGQDDTTTVVRVNISKGEDSLHIVAASGKPVIWQVTGETSRVSVFVAAGPATRAEKTVKAGVTGLDAAKIVFVKLRDCIPVASQDPNSVEGIQAVAAVKAMAGRDVSSAGHAVAAQAFDVAPPVTSGKTETPKGEGYDPALWALVLAQNPGGIADLKGAPIVTGAKAEAYTVLPQEAGLAQLVKEGKIVKQPEPAGDYKIVKEIPRYPSGLTGAHAVRFILGKGIKPPAGDPGHSCVMLEETEQPLNARVANNCSKR